MAKEIQALTAAATPRELTATHHLPPFLDYEPASANVPPTSVTRTITGTQLTWTWTNPPPTSAYTVTYRTRPLAEGVGAITGHGVIVGADGSRQLIPMPSRPITVSGLCITPSPEPTATDTPSPTPVPTATASPTSTTAPSATPSPTASPTPLPAPVYLPVALREQCIPDQRRVDVVLVIDASTSMREPTAAGRAKLDAAVDAARVFLDNLAPGRGDQAAVVAFNASATLLAPLTVDRAAVDSALDRIQTAPQTCLVCGVEAADAELAGPRHKAGHAATMIVLTDGRSNPRPASEAVDRAAAAKARGVAVFTIGLGDDLDSGALAAMASRPAFAFHAPHAEALASIYRDIAVAIPCPAGAFWGGR